MRGRLDDASRGLMLLCSRDPLEDRVGSASLSSKLLTESSTASMVEIRGRAERDMTTSVLDRVEVGIQVVGIVASQVLTSSIGQPVRWRLTEGQCAQLPREY